MSKKNKPIKLEKTLLKLDLGCGPNPREGFDGVDIIKFNDKVKYALNLLEKDGDVYKPWPWETASVEEVHCSHTVEHFDQIERCHFFNELYRVLIPNGKASIIVPHWCSCRAYGDPTHKWPPISEFFWYYLLRSWRMGDATTPGNAPHADRKYWKPGYDCDFDAVWGYSMHPNLQVKNPELQQFAISNYKEACMDTIANLTRRP